jgi:hypothetical protein
MFQIQKPHNVTTNKKKLFAQATNKIISKNLDDFSSLAPKPSPKISKMQQ